MPITSAFRAGVGDKFIASIFAVPFTVAFVVVNDAVSVCAFELGSPPVFVAGGATVVDGDGGQDEDSEGQDGLHYIWAVAFKQGVI